MDTWHADWNMELHRCCEVLWGTAAAVPMPGKTGRAADHSECGHGPDMDAHERGYDPRSHTERVV